MEFEFETSCKTCFYNFDGICASHGWQKNGEDTYGISIEEMMNQFPLGCSCYRIEFSLYCILKKRGVI